MYRKCPDCTNIMNRQNYGRRSGVIIDLCPEHGLWFDHAELDAILEWIRAGGHDARRHTETRTTTVPVSSTSRPTPSFVSRSDTRVDAFEMVTDLLFQLFR